MTVLLKITIFLAGFYMGIGLVCFFAAIREMAADEEICAHCRASFRSEKAK